MNSAILRVPRNPRYPRVAKGLTNLLKACDNVPHLMSPQKSNAVCDEFVEALDGADECRMCGRAEVEHDARAWVKAQVETIVDYAKSPPPVAPSPFKQELTRAIEMAQSPSRLRGSEDEAKGSTHFLDGYVEGYIAANHLLAQSHPLPTALPSGELHQYPFTQESWDMGHPAKSPQRVMEMERQSLLSPEDQQEKKRQEDAANLPGRFPGRASSPLRDRKLAIQAGRLPSDWESTGGSIASPPPESPVPSPEAKALAEKGEEMKMSWRYKPLVVDSEPSSQGTAAYERDGKHQTPYVDRMEPVPRSAPPFSIEGRLAGGSRLQREIDARAEDTMRAVAQANGADTSAMRSYNWDRSPNVQLAPRNRTLRALKEAETAERLAKEAAYGGDFFTGKATREERDTHRLHLADGSNLNADGTSKYGPATAEDAYSAMYNADALRMPGVVYEGEEMNMQLADSHMEEDLHEGEASKRPTPRYAKVEVKPGMKPSSLKFLKLYRNEPRTDVIATNRFAPGEVKMPCREATTWDRLLDLCGKYLSTSRPVKRLFSSEGVELTKFEDMVNEMEVYVSGGETYKGAIIKTALQKKEEAMRKQIEAILAEAPDLPVGDEDKDHDGFSNKRRSSAKSRPPAVSVPEPKVLTPEPSPQPELSPPHMVVEPSPETKSEIGKKKFRMSGLTMTTFDDD